MLNTEELLNVIVNALDDVKAKDIVVFDTTGKTSAFTRVVVCSGTSNRQTACPFRVPCVKPAAR